MKALNLVVLASGILTACSSNTLSEHAPDPATSAETSDHPGASLASVALEGRAYDVYWVGDRPQLVAADVPFAAVAYAGPDRSGRLTATHTLDQGSDELGLLDRTPTHADRVAELWEDLVPSGDLWIHEHDSGESWQLDLPGQFVLNQAWSPNEAGVLFYTYAEMEGVYGLARADALTGEVEVLISDDVVAEYLAFSDDGTEVQVLLAGDPIRLEGERHATREVYATALPIDSPTGAKSTRPPLPTVGPRRPAAELEDGRQPFTLAWTADRRIVGDEVLGTTSLEVHDGNGKVIAHLDRAYRVEALTELGALVRVDTDEGTDLDWVLEDGTTMTIGSSTSTPSFKMPMPKNGGKVLNVTQMGADYSTACKLYSHKGSLSYAIDMQSIATTEAILAAGKGSVVTAVTTVSCNSLDDGRDGSSCRLYSSSCDSDYGNYVILMHRDSKFTSYSHMGYGTVTPDACGTTAYRGCFLGEQGGTGASKGDRSGCGDHLHLARSTGSTVDSSTISFPFPSARHSPLQCTWYKSGNEFLTCDL